jgi:uncharacterized protein
MSYWPWWVGGLALSGVALGHWFLAERQLAVSGRFTGIVNRLRHGPEDRSIERVSHEDLMAALRAATALEFGGGGNEPDAARQAPPESTRAAKPLPKKKPTVYDHIAFLVALAVGGLLATLTAGTPPETSALLETALAKHTWALPLLLAVGGVFVGFGTRMAGGCTSGHGLCGVSRVQKGSLLATAMFFGCGILVSFALGLWL